MSARCSEPQAYADADPPVDARIIFCAITAVFQSTSWCLERGNRPLGSG
jgi:hypothetical protein